MFPNSPGAVIDIPTYQITISLCVFLVAVWALRAHRKTGVDKNINLPIVGETKGFAFPVPVPQPLSRLGEILEQGYTKFRNSAFQYRTTRGWEVCVCDDTMIREYQNASDEYMSLNAFNEHVFETRYTSPGFADSLRHIPIPVLTKALTWSRKRTGRFHDPYLAELVKETEIGLSDELAHVDSIDCLELSLTIMLRLLGAVLLGREACHDRETISLFVRYGSEVPTSGAFISRLPGFLKPLVAPLCTAPRLARRLSRIIEHHLHQHQMRSKQSPQNIGEWLLRWVEDNPQESFTSKDVADLLVSVIFGSVHSAGMVLTMCLKELVRRPEYIEPLRENVQASLKQHGGWTKDTIESMTKVDSFIKECQRLNPLTPSSISRLTKKDYTFNNGVRVPKGTIILAPNSPILLDDTFYARPREFDGFRFHRLGQETNKPDNYKITGLDPKSHQFGGGRHMCPGRQLAADTLRLTIGQILVRYDITGDQCIGHEGPFCCKCPPIQLRDRPS
ncbi:hypothetical protein CFD26_102009 [Aspergillus turcosus]|uniref:Cytochrome P450 n=1 Tax=Aspergillus turcosus TaxID=1245748 RepID=A0A421D5R2_9EURO|nr:hypothetical protein CFD26_102009 [Aspergillus turcosus]